MPSPPCAPASNRPARPRPPPGDQTGGRPRRGARPLGPPARAPPPQPVLPVIGTVPAIKPAAAGGGPLAIWATPATTGSPYQRNLIQDFAAGVTVTEVPCWGLAEAVERADENAIDAAVVA